MIFTFITFFAGVVFATLITATLARLHYTTKCWECVRHQLHIERNHIKRGAAVVEQMYKEVLFDQYCEKCKYNENKEIESPCDECLENPVNLYSHKPVKFEEKE